MTPARSLEEPAVKAALREGQTQAEVRQIFGEPKRSDAASSGRKLDIFLMAYPKLTGAAIEGSAFRTLEVRSLHVLYDPEGRVERFTYYVGEWKSISGPEWRGGNALSVDKVSRIERQVTTRDALVQMFGVPTIEGLDVHGNKMVSWIFTAARHGSFSTGRELLVWLDPDPLVKDYLLRDIKP